MSCNLSPKQQRFVEEYLIDLNATEAAIRAGYSKKTAEGQSSRLLSEPLVQDAVQRAVDARSERTKISQDWVLKSIHETVERCKQAKLVVDRKGDPVFVETPSGDMVPAYKFDAGAVLRGAELAGKHLRMFADKVELSGTVDSTPASKETVKAEIMEIFGNASGNTADKPPKGD